MAARWASLIEQAAARSAQAAAQVAAARAQLQGVERQRAQMQGYWAEYSARAAASGQQGPMRQVLALRRFADQLRATLQEIEQQCGVQREQLLRAREQWRARHRRERALRALAERESAQQRAARRRRDQRALDDAAALHTRR